MAALIVPFLRPIYACFSSANVKVLTKELLGDYLEDGDYYIENNGRIVTDEDVFVDGNNYYVRLRVPGGKGGFGSMLRSIGAQIEKTTNREACRDLSGRRMRDINNEKRLQEWAAKAAEREKAKAERRRERRERMKAGASRHRFEDPQYEQQKANIAENLEDAMEEGLMRAGPSGSAAASSSAAETLDRKRKCPATVTSGKKKARQWLAVDIDVDISSSDDSSDDVTMTDIVAMSATVTQPDDSGACCSHDILPPADAGAAAGSESTGSGSEENASETLPSHTSAVDDNTVSSQGSVVEDIAGPITDAPAPQSEINPEIVNGASTDIQLETKEASVSGEHLDLNDFNTAEELQQLGLDVLKTALMCRGLKCGGTLQQRAERLFCVKGLELDKIPASLLAKPSRK